MFEAFAWEIEHADSIPDVATYWHYRNHFVAVYPYLELWRLAMGVPLRELAETGRGLERLSVELTVLVNDLLSVQRDTDERKHNLISSLARDLEGSVELALVEATRMLDTRVCEFERLQNRLDLPADSALAHYVAFLSAVPEGTRQAMTELRKRYPEPSPGGSSSPSS